MKRELNKEQQDILQKIKKEFPDQEIKFTAEGGIGYIFETIYKGKKAKIKKFKTKELEIDLDELPFKKEQIDLTKIKHPNLMQIYDFIPEQEILICEDCGNITLKQRINYKTEKSLEKKPFILLAFA